MIFDCENWGEVAVIKQGEEGLILNPEYNQPLLPFLGQLTLLQ
jgi:hypothetical protein